MPEESKKNQKKKDNHDKQDAKEQRKPKQGRSENKGDRAKGTSSKSIASKEFEDSRPALQQSEPDIIKVSSEPEVLNISEGYNAKYNKKEIKSNWHKYEIPIESYEEIEEENTGADFEKLINMPLSGGGHFQFKHEKAWDSDAAMPSEYDRYFKINMDNLAVALCTIPFYERNDIEKSTFSDMDITTMDSRATKYKQKYYNDKSFATPELEASILETLKNDDIDLTSALIEEVPQPSEANNHNNYIERGSVKLVRSSESKHNNTVKIDEILGDSKSLSAEYEYENSSKMILKSKGPEDPNASNNPVLESPEDLEKWLDDFLDN